MKKSKLFILKVLLVSVFLVIPNFCNLSAAASSETPYISNIRQVCAMSGFENDLAYSVGPGSSYADGRWRTYAKVENVEKLDSFSMVFTRGNNIRYSTLSISIHPVTSPWTQSAIRWNNQPAFDSGVTIKHIIYSEAIGQKDTIDFSPLLQYWKTHPNYGFVMKENSEVVGSMYNHIGWNFGGALPQLIYTLKALKHDVMFETNGGSQLDNLLDADNDSKIEFAETTRTGYTFDGWYKEASLINKWNFETDKVTSDTTLYAGWIANIYNLKYNGNSQTSGSMKNVTAACDETVIVKDKETLQKDGFVFAGWSTVKNGSVEYEPDDTFTMGASDITLYAVWSHNVYTVMFDSNGGLSVADVTNVSNVASIGSPTTTRLGYAFTG